MKSLFARFRKNSGSESPQSRPAPPNRAVKIGRSQPALKGYMAKPKTKKEKVEEDHTKTVLDILDNPEIELEPHGFDPYNSGSFDRGNDWKPIK